MMDLVDVGRLSLSHRKYQPHRRSDLRQTTQIAGFFSVLIRRSRCRSVKKTAALGRRPMGGVIGYWLLVIGSVRAHRISDFLGKCWGLRGHINRLRRYLPLLGARVGCFFVWLWDSKFVISWDRGLHFSVRWAR